MVWIFFFLLLVIFSCDPYTAQVFFFVEYALLTLFSAIYGPWLKHVREGWEHRNDENVLFITYEELQKVITVELW